MPLVNNLRFHDYQFELPVAAGKWLWTTRLDVSGSRPDYSIRDVKSPYGLLRDSIPIPGAVALAMAESITELMSSFAPTILVSGSLTFEVDEGRGYSLPETVTVANSGVYGSLLGLAITSTAPYVQPSPANVGNLAANETGQFNVTVNSSSLLASESPYSETLTLQDPNSTNNPQTVPVTIVVRPKPTISRSPTQLSFTVTKPLTGSFPAITPQTFTIQNTGPSGSVLEYDVNKLTGLSDWLTGITPVTGELDSGESQVVTVTVAPASNLSRGTYMETLRVGGFSTNGYVDVEIVLVIT